MGLYKELSESKIEYNPNLVRQLILSSRKTNSGRVSKKAKKTIFFMMKKIVFKGISNFFSINKKRGNETPYSEEDIVSEIFMVLDHCIRKYDPEFNKNFYLYFNTSVLRRVRRISNYKRIYRPGYKKLSLDKTYKNGEDRGFTLKDLISNGEAGESYGEYINEDHNDFSLVLANFSEIEKQVLISKVNKQSIKSFTEEYNITKDYYKEVFERAKQKLWVSYYGK